MVASREPSRHRRFLSSNERGFCPRWRATRGDGRGGQGFEKEKEKQWKKEDVLGQIAGDGPGPEGREADRAFKACLTASKQEIPNRKMRPETIRLDREKRWK